jgi:hypothetical protein
LYQKGYRAITDEIKKLLLSLPLLAFVLVYAIAKLGRLRR